MEDQNTAPLEKFPRTYSQLEISLLGLEVLMQDVLADVQRVLILLSFTCFWLGGRREMGHAP